MLLRSGDTTLGGEVCLGDEFDEEEPDVGLLRASIVNGRKKAATKYQEPEESEEEQLVDLGEYDEGENMYMKSQSDFEVMGPPALPGSFVQQPAREGSHI